MAEPQRARAAAPRLAGGRILIVEARYYDAIGAMLLAGARAAIESAGATGDVIDVPGALQSVIRVLMHHYAPADHRARHVYLGEARSLREDLDAAQ